MDRKRLRVAARRYLAGVLVYGLVVLIYFYNGYYINFLSTETRRAILYLFMTYVFAGLPYQLLTYKDKEHKPTLVLSAIYRLPYVIRDLAKNKGGFDLSEKKAILFSLVKFFYVPIMFNFFFANFGASYSFLKNFHLSSFDFRNNYTNVLSVIFMVDTLFFVFGYLVEHKKLGNVVRSVEPTMLGWFVALMSYPPFNSISTGYLNWYSNDFFYFQDPILDYTLKIIVVALLLVYVWASISLGAKCSNLTNRGIVSRGAYKYVRHPAYVSKILAWWIMALPRLSAGMLLSLLAWTFVYFMRAVTEERHLGMDPDYRKYTKQVRFRFIPGLV